MTPIHLENERRPALKRVGEAGTQSNHKPHHQHGSPPSAHFSLGAKNWPPHQYPNLKDHLRNEPPKQLALKANRAVSMKTHKAISKWETEQVMSSDSTAHPKHSKIQLLACYHPQSTTQIADWNTSSVFLCKRPIFLSWSFGLRGKLQVWHVSRGLQVCS